MIASQNAVIESNFDKFKSVGTCFIKSGHAFDVVIVIMTEMHLLSRMITVEKSAAEKGQGKRKQRRSLLYWQDQQESPVA
jgi:hypothetical protein